MRKIDTSSLILCLLIILFIGCWFLVQNFQYSIILNLPSTPVLLTEVLLSLIVNLSSQIGKLDFLSDLATLEAALIGIAIPIALNVVTSAAEKYKDPKIAKIFTQEPIYYLQYFLLLPNIVLAILMRFLEISSAIVLWGIFLWMVLDIYLFFKFIRLVEKYTVDLDETISAKLKESAYNILEK